jgi:hypothetical protein
MIRAYSQRLLPPYSGVVQIAESDRARAQSFDGISWEIQYIGRDNGNGQQPARQQGYGLDRGYYRVAHWNDGHLTPYVLPSCLDATDTAECIDELASYLESAEVPFPPADRFECWLLDGADDSPLALIFSCCDETQMANYPAHTEWTALPHSKLPIENTPEEIAPSIPPVNHRFQRLVAERAGSRPKTAWFRRNGDDGGDFPSLLVREDWQSEGEHELCQRYLLRMAPRLLMLQGLPFDTREWLEDTARQYAIEVDGYYPLYPEVNDPQRMSAIRVEARLRRGMPQAAKPKGKDKPTTPAPLSKDMRILE